jgi:hypothetical protein
MIKVGDAYKLFGIKENSTSVLIAKFNPTQQDIEFITNFVKGTLVVDENFDQIGDKQKLISAFKISNEESKLNLVDNVVTRMAVRDL